MVLFCRRLLGLPCRWVKGKGRQLGPSVLRWPGAPHWGRRVGSLDAAEVPGLEGRVYERELETEKCVFVRPRGRPLLPLCLRSISGRKCGL